METPVRRYRFKNRPNLMCILRPSKPYFEIYRCFCSKVGQHSTDSTHLLADSARKRCVQLVWMVECQLINLKILQCFESIFIESGSGSGSSQKSQSGSRKALNPEPDPDPSYSISFHYLKKNLNYFIIISFYFLVFIIKRSQLKERML